MDDLRTRWITLIAALVVLTAAGCGGGGAPAPTITESPAALAPTEVTPPAGTPTAVPTLALDSYTGPAYVVRYPVDWAGGPGLPDEYSFAPPDEAGYGILVRLIGTGLDASVLDGILNNEVQMMAQEGLAPQELGVRHPVDRVNEQIQGSRAAEFLVQIDGTAVRMLVVTLAADSGTAYLLRLWAPEDAFDRLGYRQAYDQIVETFQPLDYVPPTPVPPTITPTPIPPTATLTPTPAPTDVPLSEAPYDSGSYVIDYPASWAVSVNLGNTVNFLSNNMAEQAGFSISLVGEGYDPAVDPASLLENYLTNLATTMPDAAIDAERVQDDTGDTAAANSATYSVGEEGARMIFRVTLVVSRLGDGAAYRIVQWAPAGAYESGYGDVFRAILRSFRALPIGSTQ